MLMISKTISKVTNLHVSVFMIVPPSKKIEGVELDPSFALFPFLGTNEERREYTMYANAALEEACHRLNYVFINAYESYVTPEGFLDPSKSDGLHHCKWASPVQEIVQKLLGVTL